MEKVTTIAVFIDGGYLSHVTEYYKALEQGSRQIDIGGLLAFIRHRVSMLEEVNLQDCKITDKRYFRGRLKTNGLVDRVRTSLGATAEDMKKELTPEEKEALLEKLLDERDYDDTLYTHDFEILSLLMKGNIGKEVEKGIDSLLSLETYEMSLANGYDYVVLVSGDGDCVTLVKKLRTLKCKTLLLGWDFKYTNQKGESDATNTSRKLRDSVSHSLDMTQLVTEGLKARDEAVMGIFSSYEKKLVPVVPPVVAEIAPTEPEPLRIKAKVSRLLPPNHGFIDINGNGMGNLIFSKGDVLSPSFEELAVNDTVEFITGNNSQGKLVAKEVKRIAKAETIEVRS